MNHVLYKLFASPPLGLDDAPTTAVNNYAGTAEIGTDYRDAVRHSFQNDHPAGVAQAGEDEQVRCAVITVKYSLRLPPDPMYEIAQSEAPAKPLQPGPRCSLADNGESNIRMGLLDSAERKKRQISSFPIEQSSDEEQVQVARAMPGRSNRTRHLIFRQPHRQANPAPPPKTLWQQIERVAGHEDMLGLFERVTHQRVEAHQSIREIAQALTTALAG